MDMIDILETKIINWKQQDADTFHNFAIRDTHFGKYTWETTDDGFYLLRDVAAIFFKNDGMIYKLTSQSEPSDWELHCKLYDRVKNYNDCKIEIPIWCKKININGDDYLYTEVQRPTNTYDFDIWSDAIISKINDEYILELVEHTAIILSHMKEVSPILPRVLPKRLYNGNEHYWVDFKKWEIPVDESIHIQIGNLYKGMLRVESSCGIILDKQRIIRKAEQEWNI